MQIEFRQTYQATRFVKEMNAPDSKPEHISMCCRGHELENGIFGAKSFSLLGENFMAQTKT